MFRIWTQVLLSAVGVLLTPGVYRTLAVEVTTPKELTAVNGTDVRLKCTFKSSSPVSEESVSVFWSFTPLGPDKREEYFFHYKEKPFPPVQGLLKGHAVWSGNVLKNDASIKLNNVQPHFNGTYTCLVHNPPDVHSYTGEIRLEVVQSVKLSEIGILAAAVGGGVVVVLLILTIVLAVRYCRGRHGDAGIELKSTKQESVCVQEELQPINRPEKELEKDEVHEDLEKTKLHEDIEESKLHEEDEDAKSKVKESDAHLKPGDDN
ncbi:myelin protein zero-like protein 2b [Neoarius graeffei]|uniref:myelin protein zero-like protein 2b n=1 Tax=Neoarius graeffei TaxID=443677 RepID=UPI00298CCC7A|nr:myelin protein zero-like protein 2b [Neoarius graeffei]